MSCPRVNRKGGSRMARSLAPVTCVEDTIIASVERPDGHVKAGTAHPPGTALRAEPMIDSTAIRGGLVLEPQENLRPSLLEWMPGAAIPRLELGEVRTWIIELDTGVPPGADVDS